MMSYVCKRRILLSGINSLLNGLLSFMFVVKIKDCSKIVLFNI